MDESRCPERDRAAVALHNFRVRPRVDELAASYRRVAARADPYLVLSAVSAAIVRVDSNWVDQLRRAPNPEIAAIVLGQRIHEHRIARLQVIAAVRIASRDRILEADSVD